MIRRPPRTTRTDTLFPYTTLFRSGYTGGLDQRPGSIPVHGRVEAPGKAPCARSRQGLCRFKYRGTNHRGDQGGKWFYTATVPVWYLGGKRSEEHTSELQSLMRTSYAVFCLKNTNKQKVQ